MKRIARDMLVVVAFCGAFYLLTKLVGDSTSANASLSNFSQERLDGDQSMEAKDWPRAIESFRKVVERDPYNGRARHYLAEAAMRQQSKNFKAYRKKVLELEGDVEKLEQLNKAMRSEIEACIELQKEQLPFHKYRRYGLTNLLFLQCNLGDRKAALQALQDYVSNVERYRPGLSRDPRLSLLAREPEFIRFYRLDTQRLRHHFAW